MNEEQRLVQKRLRVLEHAKKIGNVLLRECHVKVGIERKRDGGA